MNRRERYDELRHLVIEAVQQIGPHRTALVAGCSTDAIHNWVRRPQALVRTDSIERVLPRLRVWPAWTGGYRMGLAEGQRLNGTPILELHSEIGALITRARSRYRLQEVALGTEAYTSLLVAWQNETILGCQYPALCRAVGHLRHLKSWPPPALPESHSCSIKKQGGIPPCE